MLVTEEVWADISTLTATQKLQLVDKILISLHPVNKGVETTNLKEVEARVEAYTHDLLDTVNEKDVFSKYV